MMEKELEEVMEFMDTISYGWIGIDEKVYVNTIENFIKKYRLSSIEEILKNRIGVCLEQVELERYFLSKSYKTESYALITRHMFHAVLTLEKDGNFIYFEHSSSKNKGIYFFDSKEQMLDYIVTSFMEIHHIQSRNMIDVIFYESLPIHSTFREICNILLPKEKNK